MEVVDEERPHLCEICNLRFRRKQHLTDHQRIHCSSAPHICTECDRTFSLKSNLKRHLRIHTGEQPFTCSICNLKFLDNSHLAEHARSHSKEKPIICEICDKRFRYRRNLTMHLKTHTEKRPFICHLCDKQLKTKAYLIRHLRSHPGEHFIPEELNEQLNERTSYDGGAEDQGNSSSNVGIDVQEIGGPSYEASATHRTTEYVREGSSCEGTDANCMMESGGVSFVQETNYLRMEDPGEGPSYSGRTVFQRTDNTADPSEEINALGMETSRDNSSSWDENQINRLENYGEGAYDVYVFRETYIQPSCEGTNIHLKEDTSERPLCRGTSLDSSVQGTTYRPMVGQGEAPKYCKKGDLQQTYNIAGLPYEEINTKGIEYSRDSSSLCDEREIHRVENYEEGPSCEYVVCEMDTQPSCDGVNINRLEDPSERPLCGRTSGTIDPRMEDPGEGSSYYDRSKFQQTDDIIGPSYEEINSLGMEDSSDSSSSWEDSPILRIDEGPSYEDVICERDNRPTCDGTNIYRMEDSSERPLRGRTSGESSVQGTNNHRMEVPGKDPSYCEGADFQRTDNIVGPPYEEINTLGMEDSRDSSCSWEVSQFPRIENYEGPSYEDVIHGKDIRPPCEGTYINYIGDASKSPLCGRTSGESSLQGTNNRRMEDPREDPSYCERTNFQRTDNIVGPSNEEINTLGMEDSRDSSSSWEESQIHQTENYEGPSYEDDIHGMDIQPSCEGTSINSMQDTSESPLHKSTTRESSMQGTYDRRKEDLGEDPSYCERMDLKRTDNIEGLFYEEDTTRRLENSIDGPSLGESQIHQTENQQDPSVGDFSHGMGIQPSCEGTNINRMEDISEGPMRGRTSIDLLQNTVASAPSPRKEPLSWEGISIIEIEYPGENVFLEETGPHEIRDPAEGPSSRMITQTNIGGEAGLLQSVNLPEDVVPKIVDSSASPTSEGEQLTKESSPYNSCGKHFIESDDLRKHIMGHVESSPLSCNVNQEESKTKHNHHQRYNTRGSPQSCEECGMSFKKEEGFLLCEECDENLSGEV